MCGWYNGDWIERLIDVVSKSHSSPVIWAHAADSMVVPVVLVVVAVGVAAPGHEPQCLKADAWSLELDTCWWTAFCFLEKHKKRTHWDRRWLFSVEWRRGKNFVKIEEWWRLNRCLWKRPYVDNNKGCCSILPANVLHNCLRSCLVWMQQTSTEMYELSGRQMKCKKKKRRRVNLSCISEGGWFCIQ